MERFSFNGKLLAKKVQIPHLMSFCHVDLHGCSPRVPQVKRSDASIVVNKTCKASPPSCAGSHEVKHLSFIVQNKLYLSKLPLAAKPFSNVNWSCSTVMKVEKEIQRQQAANQAIFSMPQHSCSSQP